VNFLDCIEERSHVFEIRLYRSLEAVRVELLQQLQSLQGAPSVQMQEVPPAFKVRKENEVGENDGGEEDDVRQPARTKDGNGIRKEHEAEFYDKVD
jgi:histone deacetylase 1/2